MLRPGDVARPALARAFTTKLSWAGSPQMPMLVMTEWLIVIYHCRYFTGWTGSLMGCEQRTQRTQREQKEERGLALAAGRGVGAGKHSQSELMGGEGDEAT